MESKAVLYICRYGKWFYSLNENSTVSTAKGSVQNPGKLNFLYIEREEERKRSV